MTNVNALPHQQVDLANWVASGPPQPTVNPGFFVGRVDPEQPDSKPAADVVDDVDGVTVDDLQHESSRGDRIGVTSGQYRRRAGRHRQDGDHGDEAHGPLAMDCPAWASTSPQCEGNLRHRRRKTLGPPMTVQKTPASDPIMHS